MRSLTNFEALYGRDDQPPEIVIHKAGKFELGFEGGNCESEIDPSFFLRFEI